MLVCLGPAASTMHAHWGADSRASGEPPTSWWMLSMARLYLSHSLCMLSKLREKGGCVSGLQRTQLSQMQRAGPSLQGGSGFQNHLHSRPPEAAPCDSVWPSLARSASTACSMSRARHHEEELGNKLRQRLGQGWGDGSATEMPAAKYEVLSSSPQNPHKAGRGQTSVVPRRQTEGVGLACAAGEQGTVSNEVEGGQQPGFPVPQEGQRPRPLPT